MNSDVIDKERGLIFLIQGYSIQDGPGIRTTVFMKGCPLRCPWCHNPESLNSYPELMTHDAQCIGCGKCVDACPVEAVTLSRHEGRKIDREKCNLCFECVEVCPADALTKVGEYMTVEQVIEEVEKDEIFYYRSGGGVTISGGEPLLQAPFVTKVLKVCKEKGLHTALDTCGYAPWPLMEEVLEYVDLVLFDIKHMDAKAHEEATGVNNALSLENLYKIADRKTVWLRIPLIPGYNDSEENLKKISALGREIGAERVSILPFNKFGDGKYENLGRKILLPEVKPPSKERLHEIQQSIESFGLHVTLGE